MFRLKTITYQGRLGTNIGKVEKRMAFSADRNGDGKISPKELQIAMRSLSSSADGGEGGSGRTLSMKEIARFMRQSDANGDGSLDYAEFVAHFHFHHAETARIAAEKEEKEHQVCAKQLVAFIWISSLVMFCLV